MLRISSNIFPHRLIIKWDFSPSSVNRMHYQHGGLLRPLMGFYLLNQPVSLGETPFGPGVSFSMDCWFLVVNILLRTFVSIFMKERGL